MGTTFERIVKVDGAYDKRPKYGVGGVSITFILKGERGAIQFVLYTDWQLPAVAVWHHSMRDFGENALNHRGYPRKWPMAADVGYHSKTPQHEGQSVMDKACPYTDGPCYYDGSGCLADDWLPHFIEGGTDWLWPKMEEQYESWLPALSRASGGADRG